MADKPEKSEGNRATGGGERKETMRDKEDAHNDVGLIAEKENSEGRESDEGEGWQVFETRSQRRAQQKAERARQAAMERRKNRGWRFAAAKDVPVVVTKVAQPETKSEKEFQKDADEKAVEKSLVVGSVSASVSVTETTGVKEAPATNVQLAGPSALNNEPIRHNTWPILEEATKEEVPVTPARPAWSGRLPATIKPSSQKEEVPVATQVVPAKEISATASANKWDASSYFEPQAQKAESPKDSIERPAEEPMDVEGTPETPASAVVVRTPERYVGRAFRERSSWSASNNHNQKTPDFPWDYEHLFSPDSVPVTKPDFSHSFYQSPEYSQPMAEVPTRNGTLFINPLLYPMSPSSKNGHSQENGWSLAEEQGLTQTTVIKSFFFARELAGVIIGRNGLSIGELRQRFSCEIWIDDPPRNDTSGMALLHVHGREEYVQQVESRIRSRLMACGGYELQAVVPIQSAEVLRPYIPKLELAPNVVTQVFVSVVEDNGALYLQMPSHPSYYKTQQLEAHLTQLCRDVTLPVVDVRHPFFAVGCLVAAPVWTMEKATESVSVGFGSNGLNEEGSQQQAWVRAVVESPVDEQGKLGLRSLDHGFSFKASHATVKCIPPDCQHNPIQSIKVRVLNGHFRDMSNDSPFALNSALPLEQQLNQHMSPLLQRQWVRVRMVAQVEDADSDPHQMIPVVDLWVAANLVPNLAPTRRLVA